VTTPEPDRTAEPGPPLSLRQVAREVAAVYRRHWLLLISAAVVILLPQALVDAFLDGQQVEGVRSARDVIIVAAVPLTIAVNLGGQALYAGFAASAVIESRGGHSMPGVGQLVRALPLKRLIVVDVVISVGAAIGFTLFVVPGLVFLAYFSIAPVLIKLERDDVWTSLRRSADLVRGQFWRVMAILVSVIVVTEVIAQGVSSPFHGLAVVAVADIVGDGLIEPIEGLTVVVVALALMERHGEVLSPDVLAAGLADPRGDERKAKGPPP
jgi:hypothetical protein